VPVRARDGWLRRTAKGLLCAAACLIPGAIGHVTAGGSLPGPGSLALLFAGLTVLGVVLFGGRRRRFDVTVLVLGAAQTGLHLAFHRLSAPGAGGGHAMAGHDPTAHAHPHTAEAVAGHSLTGEMTAAHALATLGAALCVLHGDRVLRRLAALLLPRLVLIALTACPLPSARRTPPPSTAGHVRLRVLLTRCRPRRGPPAPTAA
jgi:hypothetical protein